MKPHQSDIQTFGLAAYIAGAAIVVAMIAAGAFALMLFL